MTDAVEFERLLGLLRHNDLVLSRTAKTGRVDTAASSLKQSPKVLESDLIKSVESNRLAVARLIVHQAAHRPRTSAEVVGILLAIAALTNDGISSNGLFRQWHYRPQVKDFLGVEISPENIAGELWKLTSSLLGAIADSPENSLDCIAGVEWEIGIGALHPFYDGCGRISRYFTAMNSLWFNSPLKRHTSRDEYMRYASESKTEFIRYYKSLPRVTLSG